MAKNLNATPDHEVQILSIDGDEDLQNFGSSPDTNPSAPPITGAPSANTFSYSNIFGTRTERPSTRPGTMGTAPTLTPPVVMMTAIMPRVFTGLESEDPKEWVEHYELVCTSNNWNNDMKINRVVTALAGHALTWYMSWIKDHVRPDWNEFRHDLLLTFGIQKPERFHLTKLINRERMPNESPRHFAMEMKKIADKCGGQFSTEQLIGIILKGINDQKLFSSLYCKEFNDFDDFMRRLALQAEGNQFLSSRTEQQVFAMESMNRRLIPQTQGPRNVRFQTQDRSNIRCYYCNRQGHMIRDCFTLQRDERRRPGPQNFRQNGSRNNDSQHQRDRRQDVNNGNVGQVFQTGFSRRQNSPQQQSNMRSEAKTFTPKNQTSQ